MFIIDRWLRNIAAVALAGFVLFVGVVSVLELHAGTDTPLKALSWVLVTSGVLVSIALHFTPAPAWTPELLLGLVFATAAVLNLIEGHVLLVIITTLIAVFDINSAYLTYRADDAPIIKVERVVIRKENGELIYDSEEEK